MQVINRLGLEFGLAQKIFGGNAASNAVGANHNQRIERDKLSFTSANVVEWHVDAAQVELLKLPFITHVDEQRTGLMPERFHLIQINIGVSLCLQSENGMRSIVNPQQVKQETGRYQFDRSGYSTQ